jgi:hypothetical protein
MQFVHLNCVEYGAIGSKQGSRRVHGSRVQGFSCHGVKSPSISKGQGSKGPRHKQGYPSKGPSVKGPRAPRVRGTLSAVSCETNYADSARASCTIQSGGSFNGKRVGRSVHPLVGRYCQEAVGLESLSLLQPVDCSFVGSKKPKRITSFLFGESGGTAKVVTNHDCFSKATKIAGRRSHEVAIGRHKGAARCLGIRSTSQWHSCAAPAWRVPILAGLVNISLGGTQELCSGLASRAALRQVPFTHSAQS